MPGARETIISDGVVLDGHLATPEGATGMGLPAVIICHGFPTPFLDARVVGLVYRTLADRISEELPWFALSFTYRGCGESEGDFSIMGWLADITAAIDHMDARSDVNGVWLMGFGTGGALCVCAAADDERVRGVACVAGPADFSDWAEDPKQLLSHARAIGVVKNESFPVDFDAWAAELQAISAADLAPQLHHRPLMVMHGNADELVPVFDSRIIADAHGDAELRVIPGVGHGMRHDPRSAAILLGWLRRQR